MRIALISTTAIPTIDPTMMGYGGIEALVYYEFKTLQELGHEVTLFAAEGSDPLLGELVTAKNEYGLNRLAAEREAEFEVIHQWSHLKPRGNATVQSKTCCSVFYTDEIGSNPVFSSHQVAEVMGLPESKVIYPGIDSSLYKFQEEREDWFLFFNRISSFKGPDIAIRLARRMGFKLKLAGHDGIFSEKDYADQIKSLCDGKQVEYLGEQSFADKVDLLSRAKALIFPFRWLESFSLVTVEALMSGCPVICTASGGPAEIVRDGASGYLCRTFDQFQSAIKNIDHIIPINCRSRGCEYSRLHMTEDYLDFYQQLIGR